MNIAGTEPTPSEQTPAEHTPSEPTASDSTPSGPAGVGSDPRPGSGVAGRRPERLHRSRDHRMLAGVADGLADYFDIDTTLVRVGFVALALCGGLAVPLYLAGWLLIPEEGFDRSVAEDLLDRHPAL
ncbi:MAG: PspC domain-containing protein [Acidimicrobiales bacterium]